MDCPYFISDVNKMPRESNYFFIIFDGVLEDSIKSFSNTSFINVFSNLYQIILGQEVHTEE